MNKKLLSFVAIMTVISTSVFATDNTIGTGNGIAYGTNSIATQNNSVAVGQNAKASSTSSIAIGLNAKATGFNSIAVGMSTSSHPSVNYGSVIAKGTNSIAIGYGAQANHDETVVIGANAKTISTKDKYGIDTNPMYSTVIGYGSKSTNQAATVIGYNSTSSGTNSIVLGNFVNSTGSDSIGIGYGATSSNENTIAIGKGAESTENNALAVGSYSNASGQLSLAIGNNSIAKSENSIAMGFMAHANNENSIALGAKSNTADTVATTSANINGKEYKFAGTDPVGTLSVGGKIAVDYEKDEDGNPKYDENWQYKYIYANQTRTITNVAAGRIFDTSTDVVNGSQLHAVITEVNNNKVKSGKNIEIDNGTVSLKDDISGLHSIELNADPNGTSVRINDNTIMIRNPMNSFTEMDNLTTIASAFIEVEGTNFRNNLTKEGLQINSNDVANSFAYDGIHLANRYDQSLDFSFDNVNVGGNQIHNVKAGTELTDAVNVSQLKEIENKINNINNIVVNQANHYTDQQINKGVAKASALAGLKFLGYNPKDKWSFAASVGHYRNANAVAVGAAYQPNENTMIHGGITLDGDVAYNLGVSFKTGGQKQVTRQELQDQVKQLQSDNARMQEELNEIRFMLEKK